LLRLDPADPDKNVVTVTLKDGTVFSGTVDRLSRYVHSGPKHYCFANLAWYNEEEKEWEEREGSLVIERDEIKYIETPKLKNV
jgi:small nuclear ribonucleoprotein (snRNP)-like protein